MNQSQLIPLIRQFIEASVHTPCMCHVRGCNDCEAYEAAKLALEEALKGSEYKYPVICNGPVTREEIMEGLTQCYENMVKLVRIDDPTTTGYPDMIAVLKHIEKHGLPPKD